MVTINGDIGLKMEQNVDLVYIINKILHMWNSSKVTRSFTLYKF